MSETTSQMAQIPRIILEDKPEWVRLYENAWAIARHNIETPSLAGWLPQMTCMPGMGKIWQWDSCFMVFMARYGQSVVPIMNNLDNLYSRQRYDGYISMAYNLVDGEPAYGERINPPIFAWAEWSCYQMTGDGSRLFRVLPILVRYYDWIKQNRRRSNGLYWFEDSGSSGMDNSPRSGYFASAANGSDVCHVDLICQQALSAQCLSKMAAYTGDHDLSNQFAGEFIDLCSLVNEHHWHEASGFYYDVFNRDNISLRCNYLNHMTIAAFWAIISGVANKRQCERLVAHLLNPLEFGTPHPVPTLSKSDPNYHPLGRYWLGGVWAPANYMITTGLHQMGFHEIARDIAMRHIDAMCQVWQNPAYGSIWECYAPEFMMPAINDESETVRSNFVGWSGLGPVSMLIESVIGIRCQAENNVIHWRISHTTRHGVEQLLFNGHIVSLICSSQQDHNQLTLEIETSAPLALSVNRSGRSADMTRIIHAAAGRTTILL